MNVSTASYTGDQNYVYRQRSGKTELPEKQQLRLTEGPVGLILLEGLFWTLVRGFFTTLATHAWKASSNTNSVPDSNSTEGVSCDEVS